MSTAPAGFVDATFIYQLSGIVKQSTFGCGFDFDDFGILSPADMAQELSTRFSDTGRPGAAASMITSWSFQGVAVVKQLEDGPQVGQFIDPVAGSNSGDGLPVNCAFLMSKNTSGGGRRNRGRAFIPPISSGEAQVDAAGNINPAIVTFLNTSFNAFFDDCRTDGISPVLFHQSAPFTPTPILSVTFSSLLATQRRRMR